VGEQTTKAAIYAVLQGTLFPDWPWSIERLSKDDDPLICGRLPSSRNWRSRAKTVKPQRSTIVCLYEDRPHQIPGLKILLLTLNRYCPCWPIRLRFPSIPDSFRLWLRRFSQLILLEEGLTFRGSFNVKPAVLNDALAGGATSCLWLDTDVLVNGNLDFLAKESPESIVVTQDPWEYQNGSTHRAGTWGLAPGRSLPGPLNSSVLLVTRRHVELLSNWQELLSSKVYLAEQAKPVDFRNRHMLSDQDGLSALLASTKFANTPVVRLKHSTQILQHHGAGAYGPSQRYLNLMKGMPPFIHAMGTIKPWNMPARPGILREPRAYYERVYLELSPYVHFARQYRLDLEEQAEWLNRRTLPGRLGPLVALNHPALKGLLQASLHRALAHGRARA
jgi:hypothetical protein